MTDCPSKKILLANHGPGRFPGIRPKLQKQDWEILTSRNIIDTVALIKDHKPCILLIKPSLEPIPAFEALSLRQVLSSDQRVIYLLNRPPDIEGLASDHPGLNGFALGSHSGELMARITLALKEIEEERRNSDRIAVLEEQSVTDYKTGLYNDRYIFRRLTEEFQRADRYGMSLSIIMVDLDDFKTLNETKGHPFADFILQAFAKKLRSFIRKIDIPGRYGGDEFLILLPNTELKEAERIAERIRSFLENHTFEKDGLQQRITLSQGINAHSGRDGITCDQFLKGADQAVFAAKKKGKNRICLYPDIKRK